MQKGGFSAIALLQNLLAEIYDGSFSSIPAYSFLPELSSLPEIILYPLFRDTGKDVRACLKGEKTFYYFWFFPDEYSANPRNLFDKGPDGSPLVPVFLFSKTLDRCYYAMLTFQQLTTFQAKRSVTYFPKMPGTDDVKTTITFIPIGNMEIRFLKLCNECRHDFKKLSLPCPKGDCMNNLFMNTNRYFIFKAPPSSPLIKNLKLETRALEKLMISCIYRVIITYDASTLIQPFFSSLATMMIKDYHRAIPSEAKDDVIQILLCLDAVSGSLSPYQEGYFDFRLVNINTLADYIINLKDRSVALTLPTIIRAKWKNKLRL